MNVHAWLCCCASVHKTTITQTCPRPCRNPSISDLVLPRLGIVAAFAFATTHLRALGHHVGPSRTSFSPPCIVWCSSVDVVELQTGRRGRQRRLGVCRGSRSRACRGATTGTGSTGKTVVIASTKRSWLCPQQAQVLQHGTWVSTRSRAERAPARGRACAPVRRQPMTDAVPQGEPRLIENIFIASAVPAAMLGAGVTGLIPSRVKTLRSQAFVCTTSAGILLTVF